MRAIQARQPRASRAFAALRLLVACLALVLAASPSAREGTVDRGAGTWLIDPIAWIAASSPPVAVAVAAVEEAERSAPAASVPPALARSSTGERPPTSREAPETPRRIYLELCRFLL